MRRRQHAAKVASALKVLEDQPPVGMLSLREALRALEDLLAGVQLIAPHKRATASS